MIGLIRGWTRDVPNRQLIRRKASGIDIRVTSGAHIGAGVLGAYVLESCLHQPITPAALGVAIGLSLLPDLDTIWVRAIQRRRGIQGRVNHHAHFTYTPVLYLLAAVILACWVTWQSVLLFAILTLGHLALDSWATDDGIMWLYPFCRKQYALLPQPIHGSGLHGTQFYKHYYGLRHFLVAESALVIGGLVVTGMTCMPWLLQWA